MNDPIPLYYEFLSYPLPVLDAALLGLIQQAGQLDKSNKELGRLFGSNHVDVSAAMRRLLKKGLIAPTGPGNGTTPPAFGLSEEALNLIAPRDSPQASKPNKTVSK